MTEAVRNIYCVGRNYRAHAAELGNDVPDQPMIFTKPTHALAPINGGSWRFPVIKVRFTMKLNLSYISRKPYTEGIQVDEIVDNYALGIDFTLRDVQNVIKKKGQPWLPAKGFLKSAPISTFRPFPGASKLTERTSSFARMDKSFKTATLEYDLRSTNNHRLHS